MKVKFQFMASCQKGKMIDLVSPIEHAMSSSGDFYLEILLGKPDT